MPSPSPVKIKKEAFEGVVRAAPKAAPINGAVHGVATMVVRTPFKKVLAYPVCLVNSDPADVKEIPTSKTPSKFKAIAKNKNAIAEINIGDCN